MALTAPAQSALPMWDDTIVPTLRKRLESESRILAKRLSVASFSSADDTPRSNAPSISGHTLRDLAPNSLYSPEHKKFSAIPRPSLQQSRGPSEASRPSAASSHNPPYTRARTVSQPYLYDSSSQPNGYPNGHALPTPDSSCPTSPRTSDVKPTRIPMVARGRTTSTSSHAQSVATRTESRNGVLSHQTPTPDTSPDLWIVDETDPSLSNATIRHQRSNIMNEPAPFSASSISSSVLSKQSHHDTGFAPPRPSNESEERPFEHWYRGDVHRNGGVGELRVGKRMEMLRIANFGHDMKSNTHRFAPRDFSAALEYSRRRKRADSASGPGERESLYLDEQGAKEADMVLDESPPTDIDGDPDTDTDDIYNAYAGTEDVTIHPFSASTPGLVRLSAENTRSEAHPNINTEIPPTRIPVARTASEPLRANTSIETTRSSETLIPSPPDSIASSRRRSFSRSQSQSPDHPPSNKRRTKRPVSPSQSSTPKKPKSKAKTPSSAVRRKDDSRASIASYPTPEGDGMVDAIPTWTQPVQKSGTWDEVVLPVVARKKGLDGQYEQADGSPRPKPPDPVAPAPGTFGYDYSKYRAPRGEEIPMDEFGNLPSPIQEEPAPIPESPLPTLPPLTEEPERPIRPARRKAAARPPDSPAPFSQYRRTDIPTINVTRPSTDLESPQQVPHNDEDAGAGCCKCVVM
ncbi:hypothetical protein DEU56DRAFT_813409 [Suillus clintonianus]|uniref:uncharacterized protein n=1 Tax=Suillus clintonianus TaxID=1904413 RepID=UPI001B881C0E|nr:uncharacterized protein DEU56DRAFT_813409 [Suillus clintonianus]KAG2131806.1 hypothetical protein DEU56DRAFT_813409 [Suillus clintonianus]